MSNKDRSPIPDTLFNCIHSNILRYLDENAKYNILFTYPRLTKKPYSSELVMRYKDEIGENRFVVNVSDTDFHVEGWSVFPILGRIHSISHRIDEDKENKTLRQKHPYLLYYTIQYGILLPFFGKRLGKLVLRKSLCITVFTKDEFYPRFFRLSIEQTDILYPLLLKVNQIHRKRYLQSLEEKEIEKIKKEEDESVGLYNKIIGSLYKREDNEPK